MSGVIAGLDIGTSKIRVVVGECNDNGTFEIIGVGSCLSTGLQKGIISSWFSFFVTFFIKGIYLHPRKMDSMPALHWS